MSIKAKINSDFLLAMKAKDERKKSALGMLKTKITEAEKMNSNTELSDVEILKVIMSIAKRHKDSITEFEKANRIDLVEREKVELQAVECYLPQQMSKDEIKTHVLDLIQNFPEVSTNRNALIGKTMGAFNKQFPGKADNKIVKEVIESLV